MINGLVLIVRIVIVAAILSGCSDWPSDSNALQTRFYENREAFEKLAAMIQDSEYQTVELYKGIDRLFVHRDGKIQIESESSESARVFVNLLRQTNTHKLVSTLEPDGAVLFWQNSQSFDANTSYIVGIERGRVYREPLIGCRPEFRDLPCGVCGLSLDKDWTLKYQWEPLDFSSAEFQGYLNGELSLAEARAIKSDSIQQCRADGAVAIGYEVNKIRK